MPDAAAPAARRSAAALVAALVVAAVAAIAIAGALALPLGSIRAPEAGLMPLVESVLLGVVALALVADAWRRKPADAVDWPQGDARRRVIGTAAGLVAYVALLPVAGFAVATWLYLWFAIAWWGGHSVVRAGLYGALFAIALHLLFVTLLKMSLPAGWL
jgi:hypothetical protein